MIMITEEFATDLNDFIHGLMCRYEETHAPGVSNYVCAFCFVRATNELTRAITHHNWCFGKKALKTLSMAPPHHI